MAYDKWFHFAAWHDRCHYYRRMSGGKLRTRGSLVILAIFSLIAPPAIGADYQYYRPVAKNSGTDVAAQQTPQRSLSLSMICNNFDYSRISGDKYRPAFKLVLKRSQDDTTKISPLPHNNVTGRSDTKRKAIYLVCAGRYSIRADAEKHVETLRQFGYSSKLNISSRNTYRVVLGKTDNSPKAAKLKSGFEKEGVSCFIEEE
jgi:hypothetical protein